MYLYREGDVYMFLLNDWSEAMEVGSDGKGIEYPDTGTAKYSTLRQSTAGKADLRKEDLILCVRTLAEIMLPYANIGDCANPDWNTILAPVFWSTAVAHANGLKYTDLRSHFKAHLAPLCDT